MKYEAQQSQLLNEIFKFDEIIYRSVKMWEPPAVEPSLSVMC